MNRRQLIAASIGIAMQANSKILPAAHADEIRPGNKLPPRAVDCHVHIFEPDRFDYAANRSYTPGPATVEDLRRFHSELGVERSVLVQPSTYGTDNRCLIAALRELGRDTARGIAVIDPATVQDGDLKALAAAGVVGVRVNLTVKGEERAEAARNAVSKAIKRVADHGLAVQIYVDLPLVAALSDTILTSPVPVILDHFAGAQAPLDEAGSEMDAVRRLLDAGHVWIKLSAPYRVSMRPDFADVEPIARTLIGCNPDRLVWASDWPHTGGNAERRDRKPTDIEPFRTVDDAGALAMIARCAPSDTVKSKIFVENPSRLFRF